MIIKLLEYNSRSKKAIVEVNGISSEEILNFLNKFQQIKQKKRNREKDEKISGNLQQDNIKSPDISILEKNREVPIVKETIMVTDVETEEEMRRVLKNSLKILRDEEEEDTD